MKIILIGFLLLSSSLAFSSYKYTIAPIVSHSVDHEQNTVYVAYRKKCNQTLVRSSVVEVAEPGTWQDHASLGVSIILYTDNRVDCLPSASDTTEGIIVNLKTDLSLTGGIEFIKP